MTNKFDENYYFGGVYSNYDEFLDWSQLAKELLQRFKFNSFLDIGCGCGNLVKAIRKQKPKVDAWGIDLSQFAVKRAGVDFVILADCRKLPFGDHRFEMVHILGTFSYLSTIADIKRAIREAYRVAQKTILFDDVYFPPEKNSDNYDPYRKHIFSQKQWLSLWREIISQSDMIKTNQDEIIIEKYG